MREKKCLGCGSSFEGSFSICQKCIDLINAVRLGASSIPGRLKKNTLILIRAIGLGLAILLIILHVFILVVVSLSMCSLIFNNTVYNRGILLLCLYIPLAAAIAAGIFSGRLFGKEMVKLSVAQWGNSFWYDVPDRSLRNYNYWLRSSFFSLFFIWIVLSLFLLVKYYLPEEFTKYGSVYNNLFSVGLFLGIKFFFPILLIGCNLSFWKKTSWIKMIAR